MTDSASGTVDDDQELLNSLVDPQGEAPLFTCDNGLPLFQSFESSGGWGEGAQEKQVEQEIPAVSQEALTARIKFLETELAAAQRQIINQEKNIAAFTMAEKNDKERLKLTKASLQRTNASLQQSRNHHKQASQELFDVKVQLINKDNELARLRPLELENHVQKNEKLVQTVLLQHKVNAYLLDRNKILTDFIEAHGLEVPKTSQETGGCQAMPHLETAKRKAGQPLDTTGEAPAKRQKNAGPPDN